VFISNFSQRYIQTIAPRNRDVRKISNRVPSPLAAMSPKARKLHSTTHLRANPAEAGSGNEKRGPNRPQPTSTSPSRNPPAEPRPASDVSGNAKKSQSSFTLTNAYPTECQLLRAKGGWLTPQTLKLAPMPLPARLAMPHSSFTGYPWFSKGGALTRTNERNGNSSYASPHSLQEPGVGHQAESINNNPIHSRTFTPTRSLPHHPAVPRSSLSSAISEAPHQNLSAQQNRRRHPPHSASPYRPSSLRPSSSA
jgi:hypothetical protein